MHRLTLGATLLAAATAAFVTGRLTAPDAPHARTPQPRDRPPDAPVISTGTAPAPTTTPPDEATATATATANDRPPQPDGTLASIFESHRLDLTPDQRDRLLLAVLRSRRPGELTGSLERFEALDLSPSVRESVDAILAIRLLESTSRNAQNLVSVVNSAIAAGADLDPAQDLQSLIEKLNDGVLGSGAFSTALFQLDIPPSHATLVEEFISLTPDSAALSFDNPYIQVIAD